MKALLTIAVFLLSLSSWAKERTIYDLMYLPKAHTVFGISELSLYDGTYKMSDPTFKSDGKISGWNYKQVMGTSLTDYLSLSAELEFLHLDDEANNDLFSFGKFGSATTTKGLSDPTFNVKYRALESTLIVDVTASALLSLGDATVDGSARNNLQGGHAFTLGTELGQKFENFQYSAQLQFKRYLESTEKDEVSKQKEVSDAHNAYSLLLSAFQKITPRDFLRVNAGVLFEDKFDDDSQGTTAPLTNYQLGAEYQYLCYTDVLFRVGVTMQDLKKSTISYYQVYVYNAGLNYQF
jgi:hypothetical protein